MHYLFRMSIDFINKFKEKYSREQQQQLLSFTNSVVESWFCDSKFYFEVIKFMFFCWILNLARKPSIYSFYRIHKILSKIYRFDNKHVWLIFNEHSDCFKNSDSNQNKKKKCSTSFPVNQQIVVNYKCFIPKSNRLKYF